MYEHHKTKNNIYISSMFYDVLCWFEQKESASVISIQAASPNAPALDVEISERKLSDVSDIVLTLWSLSGKGMWLWYTMITSLLPRMYMDRPPCNLDFESETKANQHSERMPPLQHRLASTHSLSPTSTNIHLENNSFQLFLLKQISFNCKSEQSAHGHNHKECCKVLLIMVCCNQQKSCTTKAEIHCSHCNYLNKHWNQIVCKWMVQVGRVGSGWGFGCVRVNGWVNMLKSLSLSLCLGNFKSHPVFGYLIFVSIACFRWMWRFHNCQRDRTCKTTKSLRSRPWTLVEGLEVRNLSRPGDCLSWGKVRDTNCSLL